MSPVLSDSLPHSAPLTRQQRWTALHRTGATVWFTGLPGAGKSTAGIALEGALVERGVQCYRLDGDNVRRGLCADLGFAPKDRVENVRRLSEVARLLADSGTIALVSAISPYAAERRRSRERHREADLDFVEVFVDAPLTVCEQRDPKGMYEKARAGKIVAFTGVDAPYEEPEAPEIVLKTAELSVADGVAHCLDVLSARGLLGG